MRTWLIEHRESLNISKRKTAMLIGCTYQYYCFIEAEKRTPSGSMALKIADVLDFEKHNIHWSKLLEPVNKEQINTA